MDRGLKFRFFFLIEGLYYLCSENKGADQLRGYREADLRLCFRNAKCWFSHDAAHIKLLIRNMRIHDVGELIWHSPDITFVILYHTSLLAFGISFK